MTGALVLRTLPGTLACRADYGVEPWRWSGGTRQTWTRGAAGFRTWIVGNHINVRFLTPEPLAVPDCRLALQIDGFEVGRQFELRSRDVRLRFLANRSGFAYVEILPVGCRASIVKLGIETRVPGGTQPDP
jgi:hypothetical protein